MYSSHKFEFFNIRMSLLTNFIVAGRNFKYMLINRININRYLIIEATMSFDTW